MKADFGPSIWDVFLAIQRGRDIGPIGYPRRNIRVQTRVPIGRMLMAIHAIYAHPILLWAMEGLANLVPWRMMTTLLLFPIKGILGVIEPVPIVRWLHALSKKTIKM